MPSRGAIKKEVVKVMEHVSRHSPISEDNKLWEDLGMGSILRKALAVPYTRLSEEYGGLRITMSEAEELTTVRESIDLVHKRSNGDAT